MLPLLPTYATNLTSDDHGTKADASTDATSPQSAILWNTGSEVEASAGFAADDGYRRLPDRLQLGLCGRTQAGGA